MAVKKQPNKSNKTALVDKKCQAIQLYKDTRGHITDICSAIGINRSTFYEWIKKDKVFNKSIQDAEWGLHDEVRDALIQKIADGSSTDIQFYLKRRHPDFKQESGGTQVNVFTQIINKKKDDYGF